MKKLSLVAIAALFVSSVSLACENGNCTAKPEPIIKPAAAAARAAVPAISRQQWRITVACEGSNCHAKPEVPNGPGLQLACQSGNDCLGPDDGKRTKLACDQDKCLKPDGGKPASLACEGSSCAFAPQSPWAPTNIACEPICNVLSLPGKPLDVA